MARLMNSNTALVTGGAGGIGFELCKLIAADGYDLVLVDMNKIGMARAKNELESDFGINVKTLVKDLADPNAAKEIYDQLEEDGIEINLLVNNAGFGLSGQFVEMDLDAQLKMLQVNINAVVSLTSYFLPVLLKQDQASILNVASIGAFAAGPYMATYFASKAFVLSFSEALDMELDGSNVSVTGLCPGPTDTGFATRAGANSSLAFRYTMTSVEFVAREAYQGMKAKRTVVVPGPAAKFIAFSARFVPRKTSVTFAKVVNKQSEQAARVPEAAV